MNKIKKLNPARIERTTLRISQAGISRATTVPRVHVTILLFLAYDALWLW